MAPSQPSPATPHSRSLRRGIQEGGGGRHGGNNHHPATAASAPPQRSFSFHGRSTMTMKDQDKQQQQIIRRPKTQPDLLSGTGADWRKMMAPSSTSSSSSSLSASVGSSDPHTGRRLRVPTKVLVNVNVQRSLGAIQVMASTEWSVEDLIAATLKQYIKEGRRPLLPSDKPCAFGLHYSQFSLESLDPKEKLIKLGSRNFFLCPNNNYSFISTSASLPIPIPAPAPAPATSSSSSCSNEAEDKATKNFPFSWFRFKQLLF